ncbi:putative membrane protein [Frankia sp. QA3]|nr:putative membrane protein [Frankia sp. QA3]
MESRQASIGRTGDEAITRASDAQAEKARRRPATTGLDLGLLLLRLTIGVTMVGHGTGKLFGWFGGSGLDNTAAFFTSAGYPAGRAFAVVAGLTETLGGIGLVLGLLTPLAAAAILGTLINAMATRWGDGFFAPDGIEYEILIAMVSVSLALTGPGRHSVDARLPVLRDNRLDVGAAAVALGGATAAIVLLIRG